MKRFFLLCGIIFSFYVINAQYFTDSLFSKQLGQYLQPAIKSKDDQLVLNTYIAYWQADLVDYHPVLLDLFNQMARAHMPAKIVFDYVNSSNRLTDSSKTDLLIHWSRYLVKSLKTGRSAHIASEQIEYIKDFLTTGRITPKQDLGIIIDGGFDFSFNDNGYFLFRVTVPANIRIFLQRDTLIIHNTIGEYDTHSHLWKGQRGTIFWDRFKDINDKAFAKFGAYKVNTSKKSFTVPQVVFSVDYGTFKMHSVKGRLVMEFSFSPGRQKKNPKFYAFTSKSFKNIVPQTHFQGLVSVEGRNIYLDGSLDFYLGKKKLISTQSHRYVITPKTVRASKISLNLKLSDDESIYHPELDMYVIYDSAMIQGTYPYIAEKVLSYDRPRLLSFIRTSGSYGSQPFHDDYHKVNIYTAEMLWTFDSTVYFVNTMNRLEDTSYFESYQYYDDYQLRSFSDEAGNNYAKLLYQYLRINDFPDTVTLDDFVKYMLHYRIRTTKRKAFYYLDRMVQKGWIKLTYSDDLDNVKIFGITPGFYHIIRSSMRRDFLRDTVKLKKYTDDYDHIRIYSIATVDTVPLARSIGNFNIRGTGINAILHLSNNDLDILSPLPFYLSPVRRVRVFANKVTLLKDFNLRFNGELKAALVDMTGENFLYKSDSFLVDLGFVEKMRLHFYMPIDSVYLRSLITDKGDTLDVYRYKYRLDSSSSYIRYFSGVLYIDHPDNKSGLLAKEDDGYPFIRSITKSKIFYPYAPVDSTHFYFVNYPFQIDNLLFLTPDKLTMTGLFHSSILADLDSVKLSIQPDRSLGFSTADTTEGFKIFGAARLVGYMQLDNAGLHSQAYLKFLSTYAWGQFDLLPDTLVGITDTLIMYPVDQKTKVAQNYPSEYPAIVYNYPADLILFDNKDSTQTMVLTQSSNKPFQIYPNFLKGEKRAYLDSVRLEIGYDGVKAAGVMDFIDAQIRSRLFHLGYDNFTSDTCSFVLKDSTFSHTLFNTSNVSCYMDLNSQIGTFVSNTIDNYVAFPRNKYIVYSDHFQWKINEGLIDIGGGLDDPRYTVVTSEDQRDSLIQVAGRNPKYIRLSGTKLVSMRKHNPVNFQASRTTYIPRRNILLAYDVPYIKVADAEIYSSHPVIIKLGGDIDTLHRAKILAGRFQHKIYDATVKIKDSMQYSASGYYTYPPDQKIYFSTITVVDTTTYAYADLSQDTALALNDYFKFYGGPSNVDVMLRGDRQFLWFKGYVGINNNCEAITPRLVSVDTLINPDTVLIPISIPAKGKFSRLYATPVVHKIDPTRYRMYNTFLTPIPDNTDRQIMPVGGYLTYSTRKAYYIIGPKPKVINPDTAMPMIAYDYKRCLLFADNQVDWQIDYGDIFKYKAWGRYRSYLDQEKNMFYSTIVVMDFPFPSRILDYLTKDINNSDSLEFVFFDENKNLYNTVMLAAQTPKEKQDFAESAKLPSNLDGTIVLADLDLVWDKNRVSFRTPKDKDRFAILSINGKELDVYVHGYVEFRYKRNGISRILMYIEVRPGVWYFFWFQYKGRNATMRVATYDNRAEKYISQMSKKQRQLAKHFTIGTAEFDELLRFLSLYGKKL